MLSIVNAMVMVDNKLK